MSRARKDEAREGDGTHAQTLPAEKTSLILGWYTPANAHGGLSHAASLLIMTSMMRLHASNPAPVPTIVTSTSLRPGGSSVTTLVSPLNMHGLGILSLVVNSSHSTGVPLGADCHTYEYATRLCTARRACISP